MMTKKRIKSVSIITCIAFFLFGCAGLQTRPVDMRSEELPPKTGGKQVIQRTIHIDIIAKNTLFLTWDRNNNIKEITYDYNKDDTNQGEKLKAEGMVMVFEMLHYGDVVSKVIKQKFEEKFHSAVVSVRERSAEKSENMIEPELTAVYGKEMTALLKLTPASGEPISEQVTVEMWSMNPAHLIWLIPLLIVTFPVGNIVFLTVNPTLENNHLVNDIVTAYSKAAEKLADKIAQRYALSNDQQSREISPSPKVAEPERKVEEKKAPEKKKAKKAKKAKKEKMAEEAATAAAPANK